MSKYEIKYIDPKISILDSIPVSVGYETWLKSRKRVVEFQGNNIKVGTEVVPVSEYRDRILKMGLQYTNIPTFVFEIQGSVLFRDVLFTLNKTGDWATSHRFEFSLFENFESTNYPVSSEYKDIPEWEEQFDKYMDKIQETQVTDENRVEMPYSLSSTFWVAMNYKTLIGIVSMLKLRMPFFYNIYGKLFEGCMDWIGEPISDKLTPYIDASIQQYFRTESFDGKESFIKLGDTVVMNKTMGLLLFSQFIRQQDSCIKGLYDMLSHKEPEIFAHKVFYASTPIMVTYTSDVARFNRTISNRLCWFSMSSGNDINSWSSIVDIMLKNMSLDEFAKMIPCKIKDGCIDCKYRDDIKFRSEGVEKRNLPCGIALMDKNICNQRNEYDKTLLSQFYVDYESRLESEGVLPIK